MSKQFDRYHLVDRLEKFCDRLITACEKGEAIESRIDVCSQFAAFCRGLTTLKAFRMEDRRSAEADDETASAVRKYAAAFASAAAEPRRAISAEEAASDDDPCWTDPADEGDHDRP